MHHNVTPLMVTLIGLSFLLGTLGVFSSQVVSVLWPIFLIIAGGTKLCERMCKCC